MFNFLKKSVNPWEDYKSVIKKKFPKLVANLKTGITQSEIRSIEEKMRLVFPEQLKSLYLSNNGDDRNILCGIIHGFHLFDINTLYSTWLNWKKVDEGFDQNTRDSLNNSAKSIPENTIKKQYTNCKWIPICDDSGGNHIGVDMDPDINGRIGQIITFGRDEYTKIIVADDLYSFFERMCRITNSNHFVITKYENNNVIVLNGNYHFIDYLKSKDSIK